jgi:hypothetical protein
VFRDKNEKNLDHLSEAEEADINNRLAELTRLLPELREQTLPKQTDVYLLTCLNDEDSGIRVYAAPEVLYQFVQGANPVPPKEFFIGLFSELKERPWIGSTQILNANSAKEILTKLSYDPYHVDQYNSYARAKLAAQACPELGGGVGFMSTYTDIKEKDLNVLGEEIFFNYS